MRYRIEADRAQAEMVRACRDGDWEGAGKASRAMITAILHLIRLGAA
jgi:hypothetical protein